MTDKSGPVLNESLTVHVDVSDKRQGADTTGLLGMYVALNGDLTELRVKLAKLEAKAVTHEDTTGTWRFAMAIGVAVTGVLLGAASLWVALH